MKERPEWEYATLLLDEILYGRFDGYVAATSLKDCCFILERYASESDAHEFVKAALDAFSIVEVDDSLCRMATNSDEPDFKDGIIRACAERAGVGFIISRSEKAFERSPIRRLSARDYVALFCDGAEVEI